LTTRGEKEQKWLPQKRGKKKHKRGEDELPKKPHSVDSHSIISILPNGNKV
jgi:hypothetical protein